MNLSILQLSRLVMLGLMGCLLTIRGNAADQLETELVRAAPQVLSAIKEAGYKNVGVLKFRVKKGDEPPTDRIGALNMRLADKLELALILKNNVREPIGIAKKASRVAATIPGATHLTAEGKAKLFSREYPLAWGTASVVPDAFITGVAAIAPDLKSMTVGIMSFDRTDGKMKNLAQFETKMDLEDLLETGESFAIRGIFDASNVQLTNTQRKDKANEEALTKIVDVKKETAGQKKPTKSALHPLSPQNNDSPVRLEVRYDNKPQVIEFREGAAFIPEPQEGQRISFVVRRTGSDKPRLGVVLKINGENTLGRETLPDAQCQCWVFENDLTEFGVTAFQMTDNTAEEFRVLSQPESKAKEIDYGENVGNISITVFPELKLEPKSDPVSIDDDGEDFAILTKGRQPDKTPSTLGTLKSQLSQIVTRGLIGAGAKIDKSVSKVAFKHDPLPMMTGTVKYYSQQDLPE